MYWKPTDQRRYRKGPRTSFQGQRIGPFASASSRTDHRLLHTAHVMSMDNSSRTQNAFELWTETQLSETLTVSVRTVRNWRLRAGGPPWVKINAMVRYRPVAVERWLLEQERQSNGAAS